MRDSKGRPEWDLKRQEENAVKVRNRQPIMFPPSTQAVIAGQRWNDALGEQKPMIIRGGMKPVDTLIFSWVDAASVGITGCQLAASRGRQTLKWESSGYGRDTSGNFVYLPFIKTFDQVGELAEVLTATSGYEVRLVEKRGYFLRHELHEVECNNRRIIDGDDISSKDGHFVVNRKQGTVDMNLAPLSLHQGVLHRIPAQWLESQHHFTSLARLITELNGLRCAPSNGGFRASR